jgi:putative colanic acid biosynthesis acetyltransferase WcaF
LLKFTTFADLSSPVQSINVTDSEQTNTAIPNISDEPSFVDLGSFSNPEYDPGRGKLIRILWYFISLFFFESGWFLSSGLKSWLLRCFGARVGLGLVIKPHVRIKYPWRLTVGDHCWIGQEAWLDNIEDIRLGSHVCVSQRVYLCTGDHDHRRTTFDLTAKPIVVHNGAWVGASALLLSGVEIHANAVVAGGSVVTKDVAAGLIVGGNPAKPIGKR